jgi:hypothetical protein
MDLRELTSILEKKLKDKDYTLPYTSSSSDSSTLQTINNNLDKTQIQQLLTEIINKNVQVILNDGEAEHVDNNSIENKNIAMDTNMLEGVKATEQQLEQSQQISSNPAFFKNKNLLLYNFLNFSNENVIKYVKDFSLSNDLILINYSYKELINFIGYYKISSFLFDDIDDFKILIDFFRKDLLTAYYAYLHNQFDTGFNEIVNSSKKISQIEYTEVLEDLEKSQQNFQNENEKIVENGNNKINSLIAHTTQLRNRKIILSGFLLLGSYMVLAKTGLTAVPFYQLSKLLFSSDHAFFGINSANGLLNNFSQLYDKNASPSSELFSSQNYKTSEISNHSGNHGVSNIRFRDVYDLAIKILYKKLIFLNQ